MLAAVLAAAAIQSRASAAAGGAARAFESARRETTLMWCGEIPETGVTSQIGMKLAVGFQAPPWAERLLAVEYYVMDDGIVNPEDPELPTTMPFLAAVWAYGDEHPAASVCEWIPFAAYAYPEDAWSRADVPQTIDLTNGTWFPDRRFFVGLDWLHRNNPIIGIDATAPIDLYSMQWNWSEWETIDVGDAMIRAVVGTEGPPPQVIYVDVDGGGDYLTIQEGLDAANAGDTVYVQPGVYVGALNRGLTFGGRNIVLRSRWGRSSVIIDCQGEGRAFYLVDGEDETALIEGFTVRNGTGSGGAVRCVNACPTIVDCVFEDCGGSDWGGAVYLTNPLTASPAIERCVFARNVAALSGGAVRLDYSEPTFRNCTFVANAAPEGGGICCGSLSYPSFENCIIAFSTQGAAITCTDGSVATTTHSCVYGNAAGDSLCGVYWENIYEDPLICDPSAGAYGLHEDSPCIPTGNAWGELVGARQEECGESPVRQSSWGRIKAIFR